MIIVLVLCTPFRATHVHNGTPPEWIVPPCTGTPLQDAQKNDCIVNNMPCPLNYNRELGVELVCGGQNHGRCVSAGDMNYCHCESDYCGAIHRNADGSFQHIGCDINGSQCGLNGNAPLQDGKIPNPTFNPYSLSPQNNCKCVCNYNHFGPTCNITCPTTNGAMCNKTGKCDVQTGNCVCDIGYEGKFCNETVCNARGQRIDNNSSCQCLDGVLGDQCQHDCRYICQNEGEPILVNNVCKCNCTAGWDPTTNCTRHN